MRIYLVFILLSLVCCRCHRGTKEATPSDTSHEQSAITSDVDDEEENRLIASEHEKAWEEAYAYRDSLTDSCFLQTKRPMSDDAIGPYNYHTGYIEDRAYNRIVYIAAFDRAKKHLSVEDEKLVLNLSSGEEIHVAEDLFEFIVMIIDEWNDLVEEGLFQIVKTEEGYYDIAPAPRAADEE